MNPTHLDLFSGIGGFAIAAQAAGYQTIGFCEREPYAQQILKERFGAVLADAESTGTSADNRGIRARASRVNYGQGAITPRLHPDIFTLDGTKYAGIDLLTGGFPCQPFSVAGKRLGAADDRAIWPQMLRVITESQPAWIIGENVAGIVTMELDNILSDLEGIGYSAWPLVIPACAVDAKHRRDRVWIIARKNVANPVRNGDGERREWGEVRHQHGDGEAQERGRVELESRAVASGQDVAHPNQPPRQGNQRAERGQPQRTDDQQHCGGRTQPAIRGVANGLPKGLDRNDQFCQWQDESGDTPRVTTGIKHRAHRLKGLGNAIVPQVAFEIISAIRNQSNP